MVGMGALCLDAPHGKLLASPLEAQTPLEPIGEIWHLSV